jgi:UDP-glucose 4-epimerase
MKLLVTGGAGYIGSVVVATLLASDHEVVVLDDLSTGHRDAVPAGAAFAEAGIFAAGEILDGGGFDAVLHFAAKALVEESVAVPEIYWSTNVVGSLNLLRAMREAGVPRLVFSSTAATYGAPSVSPITEHTPAMPENPYGQSKLAVDHMIAGEAYAYGLAATSLRYFNVAGSSAGLGERHDPETHLIPNVLAVAAGVRESVDVYGTDYDTPDGTAIRDYLHVQDLADAHLLALDAVVPGEHTVVNLGTGTGYSVRQVIDACRLVTGHRVPHVDRDRRPGDPPALVASGERAKADLGWAPRHGLERIVADAWAFVRG